MTLEYYKKINNFHGLLILIINTLINPFPLNAECVTQNGLILIINTLINPFPLKAECVKPVKKLQ